MGEKLFGFSLLYKIMPPMAINSISKIIVWALDSSNFIYSLYQIFNISEHKDKKSDILNKLIIFKE